LILIVIAASLAWLALSPSRGSEPTAFAQGGRYAIVAASMDTVQGVYRLDKASGDIIFCFLNGKTFTCYPEQQR